MSLLTDLEIYEMIGDNHQMTSADTPIRPDAFEKSDDQKMKSIF